MTCPSSECCYLDKTNNCTYSVTWAVQQCTSNGLAGFYYDDIPTASSTYSGNIVAAFNPQSQSALTTSNIQNFNPQLQYIVYTNNENSNCYTGDKPISWIGNILIYDPDPSNTYYVDLQINTGGDGSATETDDVNSYIVGITNNTEAYLEFSYQCYQGFENVNCGTYSMGPTFTTMVSINQSCNGQCNYFYPYYCTCNISSS